MRPSDRSPLDDALGQELAYLERSFDEFHRRFPNEAKALDCDARALLCAVSHFNANLRRDLERAWPELQADIAAHTMPLLMQPVPSAAILQLQNRGASGKERFVARGTAYKLRDEGGTGTREFPFKTTADAMLLPIDVESVAALDPASGPAASAGTDCRSVLRVRLRARAKIEPHELAKLDLFVPSEHDPTDSLLDALLCARDSARATWSRDPQQPRPVTLLPLGLRADQALLPSSHDVLDAARVVAEYFAFPRKFHFVRVAGLDRIGAVLRDGDRIDVFAPSRSPPERFGHLDGNSVRTNCVPAVNLFEASAHVVFDATRSEVPVEAAPNVRKHTEVFAVVGARTVAPTPSEVRPLYARRHDYGDGPTSGRHYHARRRFTADGVPQTTLTYVDPAASSTDKTGLALDLLCTNGDAPARLGGNATARSPEGDIEARFVFGPTLTLRPSETSTTYASAQRLARLGTLSDHRDGARLREYLEMHALLAHTVSNGTDYRRRAVNHGQLQAIDKVTVDYDRASRTRNYVLHLEENRFRGSVQLFGEIVRHLLTAQCPAGDRIAFTIATEQARLQWPPTDGKNY